MREKFKFDKRTDNLFQAILKLKSVREAEVFFRDLCTMEEIEDMSERWEMVQLLDKGFSYREIAEKLKVSTTTIGRVAYWLNNGKGGYGMILKRMNFSHHHTPSSFGKGLR